MVRKVTMCWSEGGLGAEGKGCFAMPCVIQIDGIWLFNGQILLCLCQRGRHSERVEALQLWDA